MRSESVKIPSRLVTILLLLIAFTAAMTSADEQQKSKTVKIGFAQPATKNSKKSSIETVATPSILDFDPSMSADKKNKNVRPKDNDYDRIYVEPIAPIPPRQPARQYVPAHDSTPSKYRPDNKPTPKTVRPKTYSPPKATATKTRPKKIVKAKTQKPRARQKSKPNNYDRYRNDDTVMIFGNSMFLICASILGGLLVLEFIDKTTKIKIEGRQHAKAYKKELKKWRKELDEKVADIAFDQQSIMWDQLCDDLKAQVCDLKKSPEYQSAAIKARIGKYLLAIMKFAFVAMLVLLIYLCLPSNCIWLYNALGSAVWGVAIELVICSWLISFCVALICATMFRLNDLTLQVTLPNSCKTPLGKVVNALAKHLKVKPPKQITLSPFAEAFVCFKRKWLRKYSELNVGLPLLRTMSPRLFLAVLAHELIHLKQTKTLGIVVEKSIEADKTIEAINRSYWVMGQMTRLARSITGLVIFPAIAVLKASVLARLYFARRLGRFLEFHADSASGLFIEPAELEPSLDGSSKLSMVAQITFSQINETYLIDQLPDNLPKLILNNFNNLPEATEKVFVKQQNDEKTKWYYTHPTHKERAEYFAASTYRPEKIYLADLRLADCTSLLGEFETFEKLTTSAHYQNNLGTNFNKEHLTSTDSLIERFEGRFAAMWALHRLLGRWSISHIPLHLPAPPDQPAIFDGAYKKILDYRKWRHENSEKCIETVEKLYEDYDKWALVGLTEFVHSWEPEFSFKIFKGPLLYTTKQAKKAVRLRKEIAVKTDYLFDQQELVAQYFLATKTLLHNYSQKLNATKTTFSLADLSHKFEETFASVRIMQAIDPMILLIHKKLYYIDDVYNLTRSININNLGHVAYKSREHALKEFYFFCNGRFNRLILLMADITRKLETIEDLPDRQAVMSKLESLKNIYLHNLEDYKKPIMDEVNWFLGWWYATRTSLLGKLALYSLEVEKTLGLDGSLELMVSPKLMDKLAYNIV